MNERMKELINEATTIEEHGWGASYENFNREKFAELIVRECAIIADREKDKSAGCGYITKTKGEEILEYFGVEE